MASPVLVFAQASPPALMNMGEPMSCDPIVHSEPIGYLQGFEAEIDDYEMIRHKIEAIGSSLRFAVRSIKARHGCCVTLLTFAVEVDRYEDAAALPGFIPLGHSIGPFFLAPKNIETIVFTMPTDLFEGQDIKRCPVSEHYSDFEEPPYDADNAFSMSTTIPIGLLIYVFLREDPAHFYILNHYPTDNAESAVSFCRRFFNSAAFADLAFLK